jgi:hypothetical protein
MMDKKKYIQMIDDSDSFISEVKGADMDEDFYPMYIVLRGIYKLIKILVYVAIEKQIK